MNKLFTILALFLIFMASCKKQDTSAKVENLKHFEPFKGSSVFYNKIPDNPSIDPNSTTMVGSLIDEADKAFQVVVKEWSVAVYFADASTESMM